MKSKNTIIFLLTFFLFFECKKNSKDYQLELHTKIDTLLAKSNNYSLNKNKRLVFADSVSFYLKNVSSDSLKKHYTFKLANRYYNLRLFEKYKKITLNLQQNAILDKDTLTQTKCIHNLGWYYYEKYQLDSCFYYYNRAKKLSHSINDLKLKTEIHKDLGRLLFYQNQYLESEKNISIALKNAKKIYNNEYVFEC
jgi:tetratricopeptide (TPR) repeat protein